MSASSGEKPRIGVFLRGVFWLTVILLSSANASGAFDQDQSNQTVPSSPSQAKHVHETVAPLKSLLKQQYESARRTVLAGIKEAYFQLSYLSKTLGILESDGQLLEQVEKAADARYRSGLGNQHDLLQAQLERTKLLREIAMHHLEVAKSQAQIKHLLNRSQSSTDIEPTDLNETPLPYTFDELLSAARNQNPAIAGAQRMIERQNLQVDLAHKDFYPDFN